MKSTFYENGIWLYDLELVLTSELRDAWIKEKQPAHINETKWIIIEWDIMNVGNNCKTIN